MKGKLFVLAASLCLAALIMTRGYGIWERTLVIKGDIKVLNPAGGSMSEQGPSTILGDVYEQTSSE